MIKIADAVRIIIRSDETAYEALRKGFINANRYAELIQKKVEQKTRKPVKLGSVSAAIRRMESEVVSEKSIKQKIPLNGINVKSPLSELTYSKMELDWSVIAHITSQISNPNSFWAITQGAQQVTFICSRDYYELLKREIDLEIISDITGLGAVSCSFDVVYYPEPNLIYSLTSELAMGRIDLIEMISTYTEITFVVKTKDLKPTFSRLEKLLEI
jgi:hypothetical protein